SCWTPMRALNSNSIDWRPSYFSRAAEILPLLWRQEQCLRAPESARATVSPTRLARPWSIGARAEEIQKPVPVRPATPRARALSTPAAHGTLGPAEPPDLRPAAKRE